MEWNQRRLSQRSNGQRIMENDNNTNRHTRAHTHIEERERPLDLFGMCRTMKFASNSLIISFNVPAFWNPIDAVWSIHPAIHFTRFKIPNCYKCVYLCMRMYVWLDSKWLSIKSHSIKLPTMKSKCKRYFDTQATPNEF